jgi:hypothetical protein
VTSGLTALEDDLGVEVTDTAARLPLASGIYTHARHETDPVVTRP